MPYELARIPNFLRALCRRGGPPTAELPAVGLRIAALLIAIGGATVAGENFARGEGTSQAAPRPNVVFILADDLGYGDLGCYGQKLIRTPNLDRMAAEGLRFTQFYAGSTVCAPSRSVLMTGQHTGHTRVRGNGGGAAQMLRDEDVTAAEVLKGAGYATGLVGKWGLGMAGDEGAPNKQGFDYFYGFLSQHHAHNHYPAFLWRNDGRVTLANEVVPVGGDGGGYATKRVEYAQDLFAGEALQFVERNAAKPFFLYLALTVPHANNERSRMLGDGQEVPDYGEYAGRDWPDPLKGQAAMITHMDEQIGRLLAKLKELGLDEKTLVFFSSDNGPHREGGKGYDPAFFDANGPVSGNKRSLTDGGIRVPLIARWPGRIRPGTSDHVGYFADMLPTLAELAGAETPANLDGLSLAPTLLGPEAAGRRQQQHEYLYWEFHEGGASQQAVRWKDWKGIRTVGKPLELFDLGTDLAEETDVAAKHPDVAARIERMMAGARKENEHWPLRSAAAQPERNKG